MTQVIKMGIFDWIVGKKKKAQFRDTSTLIKEVASIKDIMSIKVPGTMEDKQWQPN